MSTPIEQIQARIALIEADLAETKADLAEAKSKRDQEGIATLRALYTKQYAVFEELQRKENLLLAKEASPSASSASGAIFSIYCFVVSACLVCLSACLVCLSVCLSVFTTLIFLPFVLLS